MKKYTKNDLVIIRQIISSILDIRGQSEPSNEESGDAASLAQVMFLDYKKRKEKDIDKFVKENIKKYAHKG